MKGTVEIIQEKTSRKTGKPYLQVTIDGENYTCFDTKYFDQLQEGDRVEYEFRQSGEFRNLKAIRKLEGEPMPDGYQRPDQRERRITDLALLKYATVLASTTELGPQDRVAYTLETVDRFKDYLKNSEREADEQ